MRGTLLAPELTIDQPVAPAASGDLQTAMAVRTFAIAALSRALEVVDGRRSRTQLGPSVGPMVLTQLATLIQPSTTVGGTSRLHRVHVQLCSPTGGEVFGTFVRGSRVRAVVGCIEKHPVRVSPAGVVPRRTEDRWVLTDFAIV